VFAYEQDILDSTITNDGLFELKNFGDNIDKLNELGVPLSVLRYEVSISNGSAIKFEKTIETSDAKLQFLLYTKYLKSNYTVNINVVFFQNNVEFNYLLSYSFSISGKIPQEQIDNYNINQTYNHFVSFDFYSNSAITFNKTIISNNKLKAMYVYGTSAQTNTGLQFIFNSISTFDLYFKNFDFRASVNNHAISIVGSSTLNLNIAENVIIRGGI